MENGQHDVVIVGGGAAGITLALELVDAGLRVALLESGGVDFNPDTQLLADGPVVGNDSFDLTGIRLRFLGGTTNHWGGHCLPMDEIDFDRRPLSGLSGWPFARADLLPYYERAHDYLRLGHFDYSRDVGQGLDDGDFLLNETPVESAPLRLSHGPLRFGDAYRDDLERSENIDLQLNSNAIGFVLADDDRITGVEVASLDGERRIVEGRVIVLAAGAVENARMLMLANASHSRNFGNAGGLLGKCYLDHPTSGAGWITFSQPVGTRAYWRNDLEADDGTLLRYVWRLSEEVLRDEGLVNAQFYLIPMSADQAARQRRMESRHADRALRNIAKWAIGRSDDDYRLSEEYCAFITNADSFAAETWMQIVHGERTDRILLKFESEELPSPHNRVSLSDERDTFGQPLPVLHWAPGNTERESMIRTTTLIGQVCGQQGLGRLEFEDFNRPYWGTTTSWHQLGTTRMATSPREGVVDADARVHGTRNLFVASGSVLPTGGRANPTMTIVALTIRLADHLKQEITAL